MYLFLTNKQLFTSQAINRWTGVMWITFELLHFYQLFGLPFWRHPFTTEDPLVSNWCNAIFPKFVPMKKQTHLHLWFWLVLFFLRPISYFNVYLYISKVIKVTHTHTHTHICTPDICKTKLWNFLSAGELWVTEVKMSLSHCSLL